MRIPLFSKQPKETATDPVCNMDVNTKKPPGGSWEYGDKTFFFCGPGCNRAFQKDPENCLAGGGIEM